MPKNIFDKTFKVKEEEFRDYASDAQTIRSIKLVQNVKNRQEMCKPMRRLVDLYKEIKKFEKDERIDDLIDALFPPKKVYGNDNTAYSIHDVIRQLSVKLKTWEGSDYRNHVLKSFVLRYQEIVDYIDNDTFKGFLNKHLGYSLGEIRDLFNDELSLKFSSTNSYQEKTTNFNSIFE